MLTGIPVSIAVTPLVYGFFLILYDTYNLFQPGPMAMPAIVSTVGQSLSRTLDAIGGEGPMPSVAGLLAVFAALVAPGIAVIVALWVAVRRLFRRSGVGAMLLTLGAREPKPGDLEELQLGNLAEEMAIAAGLRPPRLLVLDSDAANAAIIGSSDADAVLVVSRQLLDRFSREETEAIVGHLIGSMSNGDLRIAFTIVSVFETFGLLIALLDAPFTRQARAVVRRLMRLVFHRGDDAAEADRLASALSEQLSLPDDGPGGKSDKTPGYLAPLVLANASVKWTLFCFSSAVVGPMIALLWRTRRYLADATAIQLTRDPDALWSALSRLVREGGVVSGSGSASYLFIVGPESGGMRRMGIGRRGADDKLGTGSMVSFHPPIGKRLERVRAQGATAVADEAPARKSRPPLFVSALMVFAWSLYGIAMAAAFAGVAVFLFTAVFLSAFFLGLIHVAFYLLGTLVRWLL